MQTLAQYEYLDKDMILKGVVEAIVKESPILGGLPMMPMKGNSLKYNVEVTLPTASWLTVGDPISESTGTYAQRTSDVYTMIQDAMTDKSQIELNSTQDPEAIDIALGAKAMAHEFEDTFITGQTSTLSNAKQFKGLLRMLAELESTSTTDLDALNNDQVIAGTTTSGGLTQLSMDELIDQIKPGKADMLLMTRRMRRKLNVISRASGTGLQLNDAAQFGIKMLHYDEVPIYVSDFLLDNYPDAVSSVLTISTYNPNTTRASGYDNSPIFALQLGDKALTGLHAGEMKHERSDPDKPLDDYNAIRNRFIWYVGAALFRKFSAAVMIGINPDDS